MKKVLLSLSTAALLFVPAVAAAKTKATTPAPAAAAAPAATAKLVHINSANTKTLMTLPGIGAKIAADIIKNRPYKDLNDLQTKVKGLGATNVQKLAPLIDFK